MNVSFFLMLAAMSAGGDAPAETPISSPAFTVIGAPVAGGAAANLPEGVGDYPPRAIGRKHATSCAFDLALRGQNPGYDDEPAATQADPNFGATASPPAYESDPYLDQNSSPANDDLAGSGLVFGAVGPQPYKFGWTSRYDVGYIPAVNTNSPSVGSFSVFETNAAWRHTSGWPSKFPAALFSWTPEFNYRSWSGPGLIDLPGSVYRFASDFELATPANNPWSIQLGFTPAIVTDTRAALNRDGFNFDGRGVLFLRASQEWMVALGATYWNRVQNLILPYAGVVWTPNDRWELRLLYPQSRISYFLGNLWGRAAWAYGGVEYHVEAYQIGLTGADGSNEKIQIADYRATLGLRSEGSGVTGFVEVGLVFDRQVMFLHGTPGFDINNGFMGRLGLRF